MKKIVVLSFLLVLSWLSFSSTSWAWGRRGHQIVGETAALIVAESEGTPFLKAHSFDIGYYANVPDFIWKRPKTYEQEKPQHYLDYEIFEREFAQKKDWNKDQHKDLKSPFELSREQFDKTFPTIKPDAGRLYWRVREMMTTIEGLSAQLRESAKSAEPNANHRQWQEQWLLQAGLVAHYIGDLSMPLHVTENHDGQLTNQKGVHAFYEETCVDELYPQLTGDVFREAKRQWPAFKKKNADKNTLQLLLQLTEESKREIKFLLDIDKKNQRQQVAKSAIVFQRQITQRLVASSLYLALLYSRNLGWQFNDKKFYFFAGEPDYLKPGAR